MVSLLIGSLFNPAKRLMVVAYKRTLRIDRIGDRSVTHFRTLRHSNRYPPVAGRPGDLVRLECSFPRGGGGEISLRVIRCRPTASLGLRLVADASVVIAGKTPKEADLPCITREL